MVTKSTEEAMAVLKKYRGFLIKRGQYEAAVIAKSEGGVYSRQVRQRMKELGFLVPGIGEYWLGAVFNKSTLFMPTGDTITPPNLEEKKDGNTHAGHPTHIWALVPGADFPEKVEPDYIPERVITQEEIVAEHEETLVGQLHKYLLKHQGDPRYVTIQSVKKMKMLLRDFLHLLDGMNPGISKKEVLQAVKSERSLLGLYEERYGSG